MNPELEKILYPPIDTPLQYWKLYWKHYIDKLCSLDDYGIHFDNPHFILNDIIAEIKYNSFRNCENRRLFKEILGKSIKKDSVFAKLYGKQCEIAFNNWDSSPIYVETICVSIIRSMNKSEFLNGIAQELTKLISQECTLSSEIEKNIRFYTDLFVTEFICLGVDVNDIKGFINNDKICAAEGGYVVFAEDEFYELKRSNFNTKEEYYDAVYKRYEAQTGKEYINLILNHYNVEPKDSQVLLRLSGVKGPIDTYCQGIHIYSTDKKKYLSEHHICKIEEPDDNFCFVNIAVPVKHRYFHTTISIAEEKANEILDFLAFSFSQDKEVTISRQFFVIVIDGNECGSSNSFEGDLEREKVVREVNSLNLGNISNMLSDVLVRYGNQSSMNGDDFRRISKSIHWYGKAKHSDRYEDKLLYSWIAIESILKADETIRANIIHNEKERNILNLSKIFCSEAMTRNRFYSYAMETYLYLIRTTQDYNNCFGFSDELIKKANLDIKAGDKYYVSTFFDCLPQICEEIKDKMYKEELSELQNFYSDKSIIKEFKNKVSEDVTLIYRLRNLIAHNATYSPFQTKLYAYKANFLCGTLIHAIIYGCSKYNLDVNHAILQIHFECRLFETDIDNRMNEYKHGDKDS